MQAAVWHITSFKERFFITIPFPGAKKGQMGLKSSHFCDLFLYIE